MNFLPFLFFVFSLVSISLASYPPQGNEDSPKKSSSAPLFSGIFNQWGRVTPLVMNPKTLDEASPPGESHQTPGGQINQGVFVVSTSSSAFEEKEEKERRAEQEAKIAEEGYKKLVSQLTPEQVQNLQELLKKKDGGRKSREPKEKGKPAEEQRKKTKTVEKKRGKSETAVIPEITELLSDASPFFVPQLPTFPPTPSIYSFGTPLHEEEPREEQRP